MSTLFTPDTASIGRRRLHQVFNYLRALNQLRNPAPRQISEQPWTLWLDDLPESPAIRRGTESDDFVLRVERPHTTNPPALPESLVGWLKSGWDHPDQGLKPREMRRFRHESGEEWEEAFDAAPDRPVALGTYYRAWQAWADTEKPVRAALKTFERLYSLYGQLEREGERLELVLGDGLLNWRRAEDSLHHPVLTVRLALSFDPAVPAFTLRESDRPVELYTALFAGMADVEGRVLAQWNDALAPEHHPLDGEATTHLFKVLISLLSVQGELVAPDALRADDRHPRIARRPVIFARARTLGYTTALEGILEQLGEEGNLPPALLRVVGAEEEATAIATTHQRPEADILFSKPANPEQHRIAEQLEAHGAVLVQGPPGTGKSYTIGNLVGHLLAQGKTVLVTSHTTKALQVVREHVVPELRPLCVSVLDRDDESRKQLESSVAGIVQRLSSGEGDLGAEAQAFDRQRRTLLDRLAANKAQRLEALQGEVREIVIAGEGIAPTEAARLVAEGTGRHDWLPGPLTPGAPMPLTEGELLALYQTNTVVDSALERALDARIPELGELPDPATFAELAEAKGALEHARPAGAEFWSARASRTDEPVLSELLEAIGKALGLLDGAHEWELAVTAAGVSGGVYLQNWEDLARRVEAALEAIGQHQALVFEHGPMLPASFDRVEALGVLTELADHVASGGKLGAMNLMFKPAWKRLLAEARVNGATPASPVHFEALAALASCDVVRADLRGRWERQVGALGGPSGEVLGAQPETTASQFLPRVRALAHWHRDHWQPILETLGGLCFRWDAWLDRVAPEPGQTGPIRRLLTAAHGLRSLIEARLESVRRELLAAGFKAWLQTLSKADGSVPVVAALRSAIESADAEAYAQAYAQLADMHARGASLATRQTLLAKLEPVAPTWAAAIRARVAPHDGATVPGEAAAAWRYRQLSEELERRHGLSLDRLQAESESLTKELHQTTAALIDRRAWASQKARTTLQQQQALIGWLQTVKKIGAGTGKRVPELQSEARRLMAECQSAIPVWIMPLARVAENFDPRRTRFDVVIVDEASQSDAMALAAIYLGRQVVVVGDDQQVSPDAVGQKVDEVKQLIDTHLRGIPNAHLYDGQLSVYDLALASFGGSICLTEHFRCVPAIIEFSNHLSYDGRLKALREATSAKVMPAVVEHRVAGAGAEKKVNRAEAVEIASLVAAAIELPEYKDATFGVISLVGDDQALEIETLLRRHLPPAELEKRRLLCGNPAQFQGDERDVIFLSMVDAPGEGPLSLRQDSRFKKRFNVAASRARDQLWVVHSLDPQIDLKPGDLRRRLIEHARSPWAIAQAATQAEAEAESPFEQAVIRRLVSAGYRVKSQWAVGHYRIDLVVEGNGKRLAIECDGERFHPAEALAADLERQAILERLGWKFVRIRGSQFFRNPEAAMKVVFTRLEQLGIQPEGSEAAPRHADGPSTTLIQRAAELRRMWEATL